MAAAKRPLPTPPPATPRRRSLAAASSSTRKRSIHSHSPENTRKKLESTHSFPSSNATKSPSIRSSSSFSTSSPKKRCSDPNHSPDGSTGRPIFTYERRCRQVHLRLLKNGKLSEPKKNRSRPRKSPTSGAIVPARGSKDLVVATTKRSPRSAEMVRANCSVVDELRWRAKVRHARITYDSLRFLIIQRKEGSGSASSPEAAGVAGNVRRADLRAGQMMIERDLWLHREHRIIGAVPGTAIGDVFFYRAELQVVGLHGLVQGGIDFVPASKSPTGEPVATSIIVSGGYEDDVDRGDELIYTGQGGKYHTNVRLHEDQKLRAGNLALERSMVYSIEIRVIRGAKSENSPSGKVYVYDGLYKVVKSWQEVGRSGFNVYKFRLLRVAGQPAMGSVILKLAEELRNQPRRKRRRGCLRSDIAGGEEKFGVPVFNDIDDDVLPLSIAYLAKPKYPPEALERSNWLGRRWGCRCVADCTAGCDCLRKNGGELPYDKNGILFKGKPLIFECGTFCKCPESCPNRVTQKGTMHQLEVFRSWESMWRVRSLDLIRAGSFVCELSGVVLPNNIIPVGSDCLVCSSQLPPRWVEWGNVSDVFPDYKIPKFPRLPELCFNVDVSKSRNVACYLSHSLCPNLFVQYVLYDHYNVSYPHLMVFAMENILPLTELSIDYGIEMKNCRCSWQPCSKVFL